MLNRYVRNALEAIEIPVTFPYLCLPLPDFSLCILLLQQPERWLDYVTNF